MINFFFEDVIINIKQEELSLWIHRVLVSENKKEGELSFIFCTDEYLLEMNQKFLNHNTYTDIISFDNSIGNEVHGDIFISIERVKENAIVYDVSLDEELKRVLIHGVLHLCGYKDKTDDEVEVMRQKEDEKLLMFHVEH